MIFMVKNGLDLSAATFLTGNLRRGSKELMDGVGGKDFLFMFLNEVQQIF